MQRITGANSRKTRIELELPIDVDGQYAFDEDDQPIEGRTPVVLSLPRFNYIPFDELTVLMKDSSEVDKRELSDEYNILQRSRDSILATLKPLVPEDVYILLQGLAFGELQQINEEWSRESNIPLGESPASNGSSKSTRRPSNSTSSV